MRELDVEMVQAIFEACRALKSLVREFLPEDPARIERIEQIESRLQTCIKRLGNDGEDVAPR